MEQDGARPNHTTIRDLPAADRPRERLRDFGANALSLAELIAILLRTGTAQQSAIGIAQDLLSKYTLNDLVRAPFRELCNIPGLGEAKAAQLKAALELGVRAAAEMGAERTSFTSPDAIAHLMLGEMSGLAQEEVRVLLLDSRNRSLGIHKIYKGSVHSAQVRLSELLSDAVRVNAPHMVLIHNHPSGDPTPSAADIHMTKLLYESAKVMDIDLTDHLVIGGGRYISMKAVKMGFPNGA
ncbi:MAG TPA: DNA repair protein RadC [Dehalococcoidia bacterium]|jgi:DNA repair protein RadC|nr:DNA repair protein RadC [Dehalococcoidia bacterium]